MSYKDATAFAASLAATLMVSIVVFQAGDGEEIKRDPNITPARALTFGAILSETRLKTVREQHEADSLRNVLGTGLFEMEDGSYRKAYLSPRTTPRDGSDEVHLLPFAPPKVVAAPSYAQGAALDIYRIASERSGMPRSPELYAKWIVEAQDSFSREMGLRYLLDGNLGKKTALLHKSAEGRSSPFPG